MYMSVLYYMTLIRDIQSILLLSPVSLHRLISILYAARNTMKIPKMFRMMLNAR